jgi:ketosteroid isomerase-like protein
MNLHGRKVGVTIGAIVAIAALTLGLSPNTYAAGDSGDAKDVKAIKSVEHKIIHSASTDEVMKYYDKKDIDLYDFVPPLQYQGAKAVHADLDNFFNNAKDVKGNFVELVVVTDGKLGMARSIQHFTWKGADDKPMAATLRITDVLHKVDGHWKVIHSHISVPVDPKTGQAQMDLKS